MQGDADLMAAWVADLKAIDYKFPALQKHSSRGQDIKSGSGEPSAAALSAGAGDPAGPPFLAPRTPLQWKRYSK